MPLTSEENVVISNLKCPLFANSEIKFYLFWREVFVATLVLTRGNLFVYPKTVSVAFW